MSQDQHVYARASKAAGIGFLVQLILSIAFALAGLWAQSHALAAVGWHAFGGLPIWLILIILYHQHRIERVETLETEQLTRADALFDEHADDLTLARTRLERIYKWGLGGVSLVLALYLITIGFVRYLSTIGQGWEIIQDEAIRDGADPLILLVLMIVAAFVIFVMARYIAGMTRIAEWQLLRGGASYLMGIFLLSLLLSVAAVFAYVGEVEVLAALSVAIPILMMLIGLEMLLTFFMSAYRPRRAGEVPRPAFDSRVLGWFTSPESIARIISETINYQFGFEVSRSWFYRLIARAVAPLLVFGLLTLILLSSLVIVGPYEQAIVTRFGRIVTFDSNTGEKPMPPGLHLKLPWPISKATLYPVGRVQQVSVGSTHGKTKPGIPVLWDNVHTEGQESYLLTAPTPVTTSEGDRQEVSSAAAGVSLVAAEIIIQYQISDLVRYVHSAVDPMELVVAIADRRVSAYFVGKDIDWLLGRGRLNAGKELQALIQEDMNGAELGIELAYVGLTGVHPPSEQDVAGSFHEQIGALQESQAEIAKATQEATETLAEVAGSRKQALELYEAINRLEQLTRERDDLRAAGEDAQTKHAFVLDQEAIVQQLLRTARGTASKIIHEAEAYRWQRAITERALAERFGSALAAYQQAPQYFRAKQYLDALAEALEGARKYILESPDDISPTFEVDLKDLSSTFGGLLETEQER